ncbi:MAG TPA: aspartyl/glutamyl-tRNA amidotransferase subunit C, partial [Nitrospirae bacterium]|nr:aspartyl/glutamyl-tRNA amidotransferase subunit C [Nitrospirota bacterium]
VDREDVVRESLTVKEALSNAPDRHEGFYRVPKIID